MFEAKTNGAKWREMSAETVDAAAPQAMPTQPSEGQRPIAELVIEDIRARAELGVRKYGAPLHAHNGRSALMDLYQELLDGAHYVRQEIEEREAARAMAPEGATAEVWRSLATSSHAEAVGTVLLPLLDALGWDEKRCAPEGPVEYARRMRSDAVQGATFLGAIAEIRGMVGPKDDEKTVDAVRRRLANNAVEIETLHAGLRAFANVRDEGAVETHRWRDRALCAEAKVVALKEEHAAVESWGNEGDQLAQMIDRYEALKAEATAEVGSAEVAPAAPVETPQATETQPDPGEGWRLLGPEEVIETGDQWWGGAMVGPVWLAASATIGETPAAINAHPKATERRVFRRLITAPIAPAPAVEPVTEVAIEVRGSKFVIVRRAVAP